LVAQKVDERRGRAAEGARPVVNHGDLAGGFFFEGAVDDASYPSSRSAMAGTRETPSPAAQLFAAVAAANGHLRR
jgi:hypothetical protein